MAYRDFKVKSFDGLELTCRTWEVPDGVDKKAQILFLHGFGEFLDAYNEWFPLVAEAGYEVTSYDQRGHGNTAKSREDFGRSNEAGVMGDIETMVDYMLKKDTPKSMPFVLWGFSMGGANCLNYMVIGRKKDAIDLYISVGPYIETHPNTNKGLNAVKLWLLPYIAKIHPQYTDTARLTPQLANNNPEKWELYPKQPLRHTQTTVEFMRDAINRGRRLLNPEFIAQIAKKPLLLSHGTSDQICDVNGTKRFYELVPLDDKTLDLYPGLPHELMQCIESDRIEHWRRVKAWLDSHVDQLSQSIQSAA